jgi:hypothetical protein
VNWLVADTRTGDPLPLLAFTLSELARDLRRGGRLSMRRYEELGSVTGALDRQADEALPYERICPWRTTVLWLTSMRKPD